MSIQRIIQESITGNPLEMKEALAEELRARVAEALAAKMEEVEQVDEISKDTVRSYVDKSFRQANTLLKHSLSDQPKSVEKASKAAFKRRQSGIKAAGRRLGSDEMQAIHKNAMEEVELDEAGAVVTHKWYSVKHWKDGSAHHDNLDDHLRGHEYKHAALGNTSRNRPDHHIGIPVKAKAAIAYMDKHAKPVNEEAEQIDEISKETLGSYIKKAAPSAVAKYTQADRLNRRAFDADNKEADKYFDASDRAYKKHKNRLAGIEKATDRLTK